MQHQSLRYYVALAERLNEVVGLPQDQQKKISQITRQFIDDYELLLTLKKLAECTVDKNSRHHHDAFLKLIEKKFGPTKEDAQGWIEDCGYKDVTDFVLDIETIAHNNPRFQEHEQALAGLAQTYAPRFWLDRLKGEFPPRNTKRSL